MANIKPFKGYRYNKEKIGNLGDVMAPPYDSLSDEETDGYYDLNQYNAVRLVSRRNDDVDVEGSYQKSKDFLLDWIKNDILVSEDKPSYYIYEEAVSLNGENFYNRGIIALLELTDYADGIVVPCENPSTDSTTDRYNLIKTTQSNNSLISCLYTESEKQISALMATKTEEEADMEFETRNGLKHRLWVINDAPTIEMITNAISSKKIFIVDGHNRYEACLDYKNNMKSMPNYTGKESYNYVMALISDSHDDGRVHLPVHRLIKSNKPFSENFVIAGVQEHFRIEKIIVDKMDDEMWEIMRKQIATQRKETKIAMYTGKDYFYRFTLKDEKYLESIAPEVSESYRRLDITVLNKLILEEQLGINPEMETEKIFYTRDIIDGMKKVDSGEFGCLFVVNPVRPYQLSQMTVTGEKLPKRSVSIFPKPATGIVIHKFVDNLD